MNASTETTLASLTPGQHEQLKCEASIQASLLESGKPVADVLCHLADLIRLLRGENEHIG